MNIVQSLSIALPEILLLIDQQQDFG